MTDNHSTFAIARMLHVDPGSVANWADRGLLKAYRTPGGHRRIGTEDLLRFLRQHRMPVPEELCGSPVRVLVVDDDPAATRSIAQALTSAHADYEVLEAHDAFQAGVLVASHRPNVVILSLSVPGLDGHGVCRCLKAQEETRHIAVLAVTSCPTPEDEKSILDCGARACLGKPLDMSVLAGEIEAAL